MLISKIFAIALINTVLYRLAGPELYVLTIFGKTIY